MNILTLGKGVLGALTVNSIIEREMNNPNIETFPPIYPVSIIIPSFNEEAFIKKSVTSIRGQSIIQEYPEYFETILIDSGSTDNTLAIGSPYVDKVITTTQQGKLTARNIATMEAQGDIIVSVDSDTYYPPFWLNTLLEPFNNINSPYYNTSVVGVVGSTYDSTIPYVPVLVRNFAEILDRTIMNRTQMVGRNSAFWKHIFYDMGMFNETINQMDLKEMIMEEERNFGLKLSKYGTIIYKLNANCVHLGGKKIGCRLGLSEKDFCELIGISKDRF